MVVYFVLFLKFCVNENGMMSGLDMVIILIIDFVIFLFLLLIKIILILYFLSLLNLCIVL